MLPIGGLKRLALEYDHALIKLTGKVVREESRGIAVRFNEDYTIRPKKGKSPSGARGNEEMGSGCSSPVKRRPQRRATAQERSS